MDALRIEELTTEQASAYKTFFVNGLTQDENRFRISPGDEEKESFPTKDKEDSFTLAAYLNNQLVGVVSFERDGKNREKLRHKGTLFRMYVSNEFRGFGIGKQLVAKLIARVRQISDIEQINLTVIAGNDTAKSLYSNLGFRTFSLEKNAIKFKRKYFDEETMSLKIK